jgi:hypothetical protein
VLDHVFMDAIGALRDVLEQALLERQAFEEHFQADVLLGDLTWETSYGLPGEGLPPRIQADITLGWPTWAQTAYRSWYLGDDIDESPRIDIEVVFRMQRLAETPEVRLVLAALPEQSPLLGGEELVRAGHSIETAFGIDLDEPEYAVEVTYDGSYELTEQTLADGSRIDEDFSAIGSWIASVLVRLGDVPAQYRAPLDEGEGS